MIETILTLIALVFLASVVLLKAAWVLRWLVWYWRWHRDAGR